MTESSPDPADGVQDVVEDSNETPVEVTGDYVEPDGNQDPEAEGSEDEADL